MKRWPCPLLRRLSALLLVLLAGCSNSAPAPSPVVDPLEQNAINALSIQANAVDAITAALKQYQALDNLEGQWRMHRLLAAHALKINDSAIAQSEAASMAMLAEQLDQPGLRYETLLVEGRIAGNNGAFERALQYAETPLQQAVVRAYLGETATSVALLNSVPSEVQTASSSDIAFIYYRHGIATASAPALSIALRHYQFARDPRGIADALMGLATMEQEAGRTTAAHGYAERAERVLSAAGDTARASAIGAWISRL